MTQQTQPIEPGAELDLAVAAACGLQGFIETPHPAGGSTIKAFRPSTDLNDTFIAAEKVGLFKLQERDLACHFCLCQHGEEWQIKYEFGGPFCIAATPQLAICAAILDASYVKP